MRAPGSAEIRYHLAVALSENGEKERARKELERLLRDTADFPERVRAEALLAELLGGA
jgi:thioredoxin-like negative regulator of GroEL